MALMVPTEILATGANAAARAQKDVSAQCLPIHSVCELNRPTPLGIRLHYRPICILYFVYNAYLEVHWQACSKLQEKNALKSSSVC